MRVILFTFVMAFVLGFAIRDSTELFDAFADEAESEYSTRADSDAKGKLKKVSCLGVALADPSSKTYRVLDSKHRLFRNEKMAVKFGFESQNPGYQ